MLLIFILPLNLKEFHSYILEISCAVDTSMDMDKHMRGLTDIWTAWRHNASSTWWWWRHKNKCLISETFFLRTINGLSDILDIVFQTNKNTRLKQITGYLIHLWFFQLNYDIVRIKKRKTVGKLSLAQNNPSYPFLKDPPIECQEGYC